MKWTADDFHTFFDDNVAGVRASTNSPPPPLFIAAPEGSRMSVFRRVTSDDVIAVVRQLPDEQRMQRLQSVLNAAARLVFSARKHDHITPLLKRAYIGCVCTVSRRRISRTNCSPWRTWNRGDACAPPRQRHSSSRRRDSLPLGTARSPSSRLVCGTACRRMTPRHRLC